MPFDQYEDLIGKRALQDIVDSRGVLLVAAYTILTKSMVEKLRNFNFEIIYNVHVEESLPEPSDRVEVGVSDTKEVIRQTEVQLHEIEHYVQTHDKVPLDALKERVLPSILETTKKSNVYQLFSDLNATQDFRFKQSISVAILSTLIGKWLKLGEKDLSVLTLAASLYDIGLVKLPKSLIHKPDRYQPYEYEIVKQHTIFGYNLLKASGDLDPRVALVALQHHEREDGSGYPGKRKGPEIEFFSKIVAIADVYMAKMAARPHRPAFSFYEVIADLQREIIHGRFDSTIGMTFLNRMMNAQIGSEVLLSDGRRGKILLINPNYPTSPLVSMEEGFVDLSQDSVIKIKQIMG